MDSKAARDYILTIAVPGPLFINSLLPFSIPTLRFAA
jgi:hypothetical protein